MADDAAVDPQPTRSSVRRLVEIVVLSSFAIAQPLLDVTGRSPETFVFYRVGGAEVIVFVLLLVLLPPLMLWLLVTGLALVSPTVGSAAYAVVVGGLMALTVLQLVKNVSDLRGPLLVIVAVVVAAAALRLFARSDNARSFVTYLTPAPLVFALLFVLASPTGALVRPAEREAASTAGTRSGGPAPPVVMILLDEFPLVSLLNSKGQVDDRIFPNFARLAASSHWYRNGTGVGGFTQYAVPAVLTGRYPETELAPSYVQQPDSIFSLLAPHYRIRAFETITQMCDPSLCEEVEPTGREGGLTGLFGQTWQVAKKLVKPYDDSAPISDQFAEKSARQETSPRLTIDATQTEPNWTSLRANQPERFQRFLAGLQPRDEPTMHFLHLLLPHHPWRFLPSGSTHPPKLLGQVGKNSGTYAWPLEVNRQAHLLQLAYTDRLLGDVIDRLQEQGIWDDALVVVTADHGQSMLPGTSGRRLTDQAATEAQIAWVPVFIKEPGQTRGETSDANWEQVDLAPTMAEALGLAVPFEVDGISHLSGTRDRSKKYFYNDPGERIEFPAAPAFRIVLEGVTDTFVRGSQGQDGLYVMGSRPDWIGRTVSSLTALGVDVEGAPSHMRARLEPDLDFDAVDPASGVVPALVTGTLEQSSGGGPVVIAINGTVAAVSEIYPEEGRPSFAGMVNDKLFKPGANRVALYEVVGDSDPELRPIAIR